MRQPQVRLQPTQVTKLILLQGKGVAKCYSSGTLNLPSCVIIPRVLILKYLPGAMTLKDVPHNLIIKEVIKSLVSTVASFGLLGVTHCDLNDANILFTSGLNGIKCSVIAASNPCVGCGQKYENSSCFI
jgi:hypothetical protein